MNDLFNTKVSMRMSDPWDLGESVKWQSFNSEIIGVDNDQILIRLLEPFTYKGVVCEFFVASPRHEGDHVKTLHDGKSLFCGLTRISPEQANSHNPFDLSQWRGGIAIIGNIDPL